MPELDDGNDSTQPEPRYYVFWVHTVDEPHLVSVISGPFVEFANAWYSAGANRRIYPDRIFIAGEIC